MEDGIDSFLKVEEAGVGLNILQSTVLLHPEMTRCVEPTIKGNGGIITSLCATGVGGGMDFGAHTTSDHSPPHPCVTR